MVASKQIFFWTPQAERKVEDLRRSNPDGAHELFAELLNDLDRLERGYLPGVIRFRKKYRAFKFGPEREYVLIYRHLTDDEVAKRGFEVDSTTPPIVIMDIVKASELKDVPELS